MNPSPTSAAKPPSRNFQNFQNSKSFPGGTSTAARRARPRAAPRIACSNPWPSIPTPPRRTARSSCARCSCPTRRPRTRPTPAPRFPMTPAPGSVSSRNIFSTRTARRSASRPVAAFPRRRVNTTPPSATGTSAASPARLWTRTSTSASTPASTTKASIPKSPRASGNSRSSAKAPRTPPTRCGSPATS